MKKSKNKQYKKYNCAPAISTSYLFHSPQSNKIKLGRWFRDFRPCLFFYPKFFWGVLHMNGPKNMLDCAYAAPDLHICTLEWTANDHWPLQIILYFCQSWGYNEPYTVSGRSAGWAHFSGRRMHPPTLIKTAHPSNCPLTV